MRNDIEAARAQLANPETVRARAQTIADFVAAGHSRHFRIDEGHLAQAAEALAGAIRGGWRDLRPPVDSVWRSLRLTPASLERLATSLEGEDAQERARAGFDLAALAILAMPHAFDKEPLEALTQALTDGHFGGGRPVFEAVSASSTRLPTALSQNLGAAFGQRLQRFCEAMRADPAHFGEEGRFGSLADRLGEAARSGGGTLPIEQVLTLVLPLLEPLVEGGAQLRGRPLGDVWRHPWIEADTPMHGLVPFHSAALRLVCSLIEPLEEVDVRLEGLQRLPAPATRNLARGMVSLGLIQPRHAALGRFEHPAGSDIVVELRALSTARLSDFTKLAHEHLGLRDLDLPEACMAEPLALLCAHWRSDSGIDVSMSEAFF